MRHEVVVSFGARQEFVIPLDGTNPMPDDVARWWLDEQYVKLECVPVRASGKVLLADKVLGIASALGPDGFADEGFAREFARAALAALHKPTVRIDVAEMAISY